MKIYTRTGDKGKTSLFGGKRVYKFETRVDTYGTVDELNSIIGVAVAELKKGKVKEELERIQHDLLVIGASLANPSPQANTRLQKRVSDLERVIDEMTEKLPRLKNFILPGGGKAGAYLHMARTICRRAERRLVQLLQKEQIDEQVITYINRLSDVLFTMARFVNYKEKKKETIWVKAV